MKVLKKVLLATASLSMISLFVPRNSAAQGVTDARKQLLVKTARTFFDSLKRRDLLIELDDSKIQWKLNEDYEVALPSEKQEHPQGVFYFYNNHLWPVTPDSFYPALFNDRVVRVVNTNQFVSRDTALTTAKTFLEANFPTFFNGEETLTEENGPDSSGAYSFRWQKYREDTLPGDNMWAFVRSIDGKVAAFSSSTFTGEWEHKIEPAEALAKVVDHFKKDGRVREPKIDRWGVTGGGGMRFYEIGVSATDVKSGKIIATGVMVNAMDGTIAGGNTWQQTSLTADERTNVNDRLPVWTKQGLIFSAERKLTPMPSWAPTREQLFNLSCALCEWCKRSPDQERQLRSGEHNQGYNYHRLQRMRGRFATTGLPQRPAMPLQRCRSDDNCRNRRLVLRQQSCLDAALFAPAWLHP